MTGKTNPIGDEVLHAYVDGMLSDEERAHVDQAIARDPALAARVNDYFALNTLLRERYDRVLGEPVPKRLRPAALQRRRSTANWPWFAGLAAALLIGIGIGAEGGMRLGYERTPSVAGLNETGAVLADASRTFARRAAIAHVVYMPTVERPSQLGASHEQDFVRWLSAKLGTDIHPPILLRSGYELMGGRLLHDADGEMAMFMYRDAQGRRVTLSISHRKASADTTAFALYRDGPVNVFYWVDGDFGYAISSGIDRPALLALSHDVHEQLRSRPSAAKQPSPG